MALVTGSSYAFSQNTYQLVTDVSSLSDGDKIILLNSKTDGSHSAMSAANKGNNRKSVLVTISSNTVTTAVDNDKETVANKNTKSDDITKPMEVTLVKSGDNWNLKEIVKNDGIIYLNGGYASKGNKNYLNAAESVATGTNASNGVWTISIANTGIATIKNGNNFTIYLNRSIYASYSTKANNYDDVYIYKKINTYSITAESNDNAKGTVSLTGTTITATPSEGCRVMSGVAGYTVSSGTATVAHEGYSNTLTVTPSSDCTIRVNFEVTPTYILNTAVSPLASGIIELGSTTVAEGATTTATASAAAGYKFVSWSISGTDAELSSTTDNPTTVTMGTEHATITANFETVTTYAINWNVNGVNVRTDNVEENTAITFPKAISGVPAGYELLGWVAEANKIDTPTDTDPSANYITSATSTADITYYAVMAVGVTGTETATLELTSTEGYSTSYDSQSFTDNKGNTWSGSVAVSTQDGKPCIQMKTSSGGSAITAPTFPGIITEIKMLARNGSSKTARSFNFNSVSNSNTGDLGTLSVAANHKYDSELTATLKSEFNSFYLWVTDNLGFNKISVTYNATTYSNYCTTVPTATVNINALCNDGEETPTYYSTYSNDKAFVVPADMTVSAIKVADGKLVVTSYDEGDIVKAGTGVMVSSATSGNHTITLAAGGDEIEDNCLYASGDAGIDAAGMAAIVDDCKYYRLTMHGYEAGVNPGDLGFFWGAASGAAFALAANKAFLAVPTALAKEGFSISFDGENIDDPSSETTAIAGVETMKEVGTTYNLAGQKVNASYKGIVIVNGKKFINK